MSNTVKLALSWGFVGIPLAWGVLVTLINALKLFS
ncbi:MAG: MFS transporter small subunit [Vulcanimicrobiaceae bacterium]